MTGTEHSSGDMLLSEKQADAAPAPGMLGPLAPEDRARVEAHGRRIAYERGQTIFRQGDAHDGVMLIQRGLVRSFYAAPQGREITLAY